MPRARARGRTAGSPGSRGVEDVRCADDLRADEARGADGALTGQEAAARRARYGPNVLEQRRRSAALELLSHFWAPIPWMIEAALVLTAVTGRWLDFGIIFALLLLNGLVGFSEEHQAANAIAALKERLAARARVMRDGAWTDMVAADVVPGDLIMLARGDVVPADGVVVAGALEVDESALTGESLPVERGPADEVFSGTVVARGTPSVRVLATGARTAFGRTAELTGAEPPPSHFQRAVTAIGRDLIGLASVLVTLIVIVSLLRGNGIAPTLEFALVVTIASIPVALPAVLSVTMAVGARSLARRQAVVSHLPAVEEMSGVDVLCADKTGTITRNELAVADVVALRPDADPDAVLREAALTVEADGDDPVDRAVLAALETPPRGVDVVELDPFDADRKRAVARVRDRDGTEFRVAKGAVQAIVDLAGADDPAAAHVSEATACFAARGYRALAVARADADVWRLSGVLGIQDPPRADSGETLAQASRLGVAVKMVTGDRVEIAREIAGEVGLGDRVVPADAVGDLTDGALADAVEAADGFAQVVPEDKYRIVRALQARGHIVGMTGDGVNDAPALRRADAGIAVSGATAAARAAADIVLLAPGLSVIVDAIHRAREVFRRMTNYAVYRISETIRVVLFATLAIVAFDFFPVTPIQIVLLAILNDAAILTIAYDRVLPSARPERWNLTAVLSVAGVLGAVGVIGSFVLVVLALGPLSLGDEEIQTLVYLKLSVAGHLTLFVARTRGRLWSHRPATVLLVAVVGTQILATVIAATGILMEPLGWPLLALAWGYALVWMLLLDEAKIRTYRVLERRGVVAPELRRDVRPSTIPGARP